MAGRAVPWPSWWLLVLFLIPWGISLAILEERHEATVRQRRMDLTEDLRQVVGHLRRLADPPAALTEQIERYRRALRWDVRSASRLARRLQPVARLFFSTSRDAGNPCRA